MTDLAKRWMESEHWGGWRVGMVESHMGEVCARVCECGCERPVFFSLHEAWDQCDHSNSFSPGGPYTRSLPDLTHPGTLAFLLEDVRAAWGASSINVDIMPNGRCDIEAAVHQSGDGNFAVLEFSTGYQPTTAGALILALEAAP